MNRFSGFQRGAKTANPEISRAVAANFTTFYVVKFVPGGPRPAGNRNLKVAATRRGPFEARVKFPG